MAAQAHVEVRVGGLAHALVEIGLGRLFLTLFQVVFAQKSENALSAADGLRERIRLSQRLNRHSAITS